MWVKMGNNENVVSGKRASSTKCIFFFERGTLVFA